MVLFLQVWFWEGHLIWVQVVLVIFLVLHLIRSELMELVLLMVFSQVEPRQLILDPKFINPQAF